MTTGLGPLYDGVSHFALTPEDLLPALALALLAGQQGALAGRLALFVLPGAWLAGVSWASRCRRSTPRRRSPRSRSSRSAASSRWRRASRPEWLAGLALLVGVLHGYLNGASMATARLGALGLLGIASALFVLVALAAALVVATRVAWGRIAFRVAGSWIVAIGLLLLGWSLRPA